MINIFFQDGFLTFVIIAVSLVVAVTIHEFAHAFVADKLGDPTPRLNKRLSLNPAVHLDPIGTLMILLLGFGWGKPVTFDPYNLRNPRRDAALISLAGPTSNIILAIILSIIVRVIAGPFSPYMAIINILSLIVFYNLLLAFFNLIPVHPLDGGKIFVGFLPPNQAEEADQFLRRYGLLILIFLIFPIIGGKSPITSIFLPFVSKLMDILLPGNVLT